VIVMDAAIEQAARTLAETAGSPARVILSIHPQRQQ